MKTIALQLHKHDSPQRQYSGHNTLFGHYIHTDHGPTGLGQYDGLGEYCCPHTAPSVFLIIISMCAHLLTLRSIINHSD